MMTQHHNALMPCTKTPDCYMCLAIHAQNKLLWRLRMPTAAQAEALRERVARPLVERIVARASGAKLVVGDVGSLRTANLPQSLYAEVVTRLNAPVANFESLASHIELLLKSLWYRGQLPSDAFHQLRLETLALQGTDVVRDEVFVFLKSCDQHPNCLEHHMRHARARIVGGSRRALEVVDGLRGVVRWHMGVGVRTRGERWVCVRCLVCFGVSFPSGGDFPTPQEHVAPPRGRAHQPPRPPRRQRPGAPLPRGVHGAAREAGRGRRDARAQRGPRQAHRRAPAAARVAGGGGVGV